MVPLVFFAASCLIGGGKIHIQKRQEATLTSLPNIGYDKVPPITDEISWSPEMHRSGI